MDMETIGEMVVMSMAVVLPIVLCVLFMWIDKWWQAWLRRTGRIKDWDAEKHCRK